MLRLSLVALALAAPAAAQDECKDCDVVIHAPSSPVTVERTFQLDARTGTVRFGDGLRGAIPPTGTSVTTTYRTGSGGGATVSRVGGELSASVVTLKPALVTLPEAARDDDEEDEN